MKDKQQMIGDKKRASERLVEQTNKYIYTEYSKSVQRKNR